MDETLTLVPDDQLPELHSWRRSRRSERPRACRHSFASSTRRRWCDLLGGNGILLEHNVGRYVADAGAIYSYEGSREMNTLIVGRSVTGQSAFV
jgi:hypothetical protein